MKNKNQITMLLLLVLFQVFNVLTAQKNYTFKTVEGDPLKARIYTLDNGLKVYMSVSKDEPKIQTYVAVRVGGKHDPAETTGLAHYFEHMMFKGTMNFGTMDWEKESGLIDEIENLFEKYRAETDIKKRAAIYKIIDSISYEASKLAIPNEYDKLVKTIGSTGTNASTSYDYTIYIENIPSNQLENWAKIQIDRLKYPVLRLFHTELETVYEEKNMSLTNDSRKAGEALFSELFPNHPYGNQTVLGEAEHLKNPSMKNIREFFAQYYVPNNIAVILAGDFEPDYAIEIVDKYFGRLKQKELPDFTFEPESPLKEPRTREVIGLEAEHIMVAFRFQGALSDDVIPLNMLSMMLYNGKAGLIDLNLNQNQKVLNSYSYPWVLNDYSSLIFFGIPKAGQTLDEVKDLLLEQIELLKKGEFPDWMLDAAVNNLKLQEMKRFETNHGKARTMMNAFLNGISWEKQVNYIKEISQITKKDLLMFANAHLASNYVVIYKRQGTPEDLPKVEKPPITPVELNRDAKSDFMKQIAEAKVEDIQPVFVDYNKDIRKAKTKSGLDVLYVPNIENNTFNLYYHLDIGRYNAQLLSLAINYLPYLGTSKFTAAEIQQEFYKLACSFNISAADEETWVSVSGISDNFAKALSLVEQLLTDPVANEEALKNLINDMLKERKDAKANQNSNFRALIDYATYGENSPDKYILTENELRNVKPQQLIEQIKNLSSYKHKVLFYGNQQINEVINTVARIHKVPAKWKTIPKPVKFEELETNENKVFFAEYDANQSYLRLVMKSQKFAQNLIPSVRMYNEYFGGSMNAIVFQEMREKRALAYASSSRYQTPRRKDEHFMNIAFIATQNDKVVDAFDAFNELFNEMPLSNNTFQLSKNSIINNIQTERITKMQLIWNYISNQRLGLESDIRKTIYEQLPTMTIEDVVKFNDGLLKNKPKTYVILGRESNIDFKELEKFGTVRKLTQEEIFGY